LPVQEIRGSLGCGGHAETVQRVVFSIDGKILFSGFSRSLDDHYFPYLCGSFGLGLGLRRSRHTALVPASDRRFPMHLLWRAPRPGSLPGVSALELTIQRAIGIDATTALLPTTPQLVAFVIVGIGLETAKAFSRCPKVPTLKIEGIF